MSEFLIFLILFIFAAALWVLSARRAKRKWYVATCLVFAGAIMCFLPFCTNCWSSTNVVFIAYGLPGHEMLETARKGKIALGGCCVDLPMWYCKKCDRRWPSWPEKPISFSKQAYTATFEDGNPRDKDTITSRTISSDGKGHMVWLDAGGRNTVVDLLERKIYFLDPENKTAGGQSHERFEILALRDNEEGLFKSSSDVNGADGAKFIGEEAISDHSCRHWRRTNKNISGHHEDWWFDKNTSCLVLHENKAPIGITFFERLVRYSLKPAPGASFKVPSDYIVLMSAP